MQILSDAPFLYLDQSLNWQTVHARVDEVEPLNLEDMALFGVSNFEL